MSERRRPTSLESQPAPRALAALAARFDLGADAEASLRALVRLIAEDPLAPTTVRDPVDVVERHLADSLAALELEPVRAAKAAVDIGSGAGFPGLPLAVALRRTRFALLEASARKCTFLERAVAACGLENVEVVHARAEELPGGRDRFDLATARALARLDVVIEYAAPLLALGGWLVAWRGQREPEVERAGARAAERLGMEVVSVRRVRPFAGARGRHLHLLRKVAPTPAGFPRRVGVAAKRPLGGRASNSRA